LDTISELISNERISTIPEMSMSMDDIQIGTWLGSLVLDKDFQLEFPTDFTSAGIGNQPVVKYISAQATAGLNGIFQYALNDYYPKCHFLTLSQRVNKWVFLNLNCLSKLLSISFLMETISNEKSLKMTAVNLFST
jgi:hypothetical protein